MSERESLGEALPKAIAKVSEFIGKQDAQAKELDEVIPGSGAGNRMIAGLLRQKVNVAINAQTSGDVIAMIQAYTDLKPAIELAKAYDEDTPKET